MTNVNPHIRDTAEALNPQRSFIPAKASGPALPSSGWMEQGGIWHEIKDGLSLCRNVRQGDRRLRPFLYGGSRPCLGCQKAARARDDLALPTPPPPPSPAPTAPPATIVERDQAIRNLVNPAKYVLMKRVLGNGGSQFEEVDVYDDIASARAGRRMLRKTSSETVLIQLMIRREGQEDQPEGPMLYGLQGRDTQMGRPTPTPAPAPAPTPSTDGISQQIEQLIQAAAQKALAERDAEITRLQQEVSRLSLARIRTALQESA